jgi:cobalt-precorrin-5B (C1)-methyltransferase
MTHLRSGYTTCTFAAAAAKAAVCFLVEGISLQEVDVPLPGGDRATIPLSYVKGDGATAEAAVRKDGGDDPDITHGALIVANVRRTFGCEIELAAGEGIGTVTRPGLSVLPGEPAINPVPARMIRAAVRECTNDGVFVLLSIPQGAELAKRTYNPRLGITGGLSILGTSGRVLPFSCPALRASLKCLLDIMTASGTRAPVLVPGRIGERAAKTLLNAVPPQVIAVGNEWGFMLDCADNHDLEAILILGHPGKLAKLAAGDWDTHSSRSKSALPFVAAMAEALTGKPLPETTTVEGIFAALRTPAREELGNALAGRIGKAVKKRSAKIKEVAVLLVSMQGEQIGRYGEIKRWL